MTDRLAIDFGTSTTVAVVGGADRTRTVLFDGAPLLPSAVYAGPGGELYTGRDAVHMARLDPARFEPNPKRRVDDGTVLLGDREYPVVGLVAAVLGRVARETVRAVGALPPAILTCPVGWGATRRGILTDAARRAGLTVLGLVTEPVAAAAYFTGVLGRRLPVGHGLVVFDFGGGTLDVAVLRHAADGDTVVGSGGLDDLGGLDFDAAVVDHLLAPLPDGRRTVPDVAARQALWADARSAKEILTRASTAAVQVPGRPAGTHLTRAEFETLARPLVDRAVAATVRIVHDSRVPAGALAGVLLVGGASQVPMVAGALHTATGVAPTVLEQPELAVAEGALAADAGTAPLSARAEAALDALSAPRSAVPVPEAVPESPSRRRVLLPVAAIAVVAALLALGTTALVQRYARADGGGAPSSGGHPTPSPSFRPVEPSALASAALRDFVHGWDAYGWSGADGCRVVHDEPEYQPDGHVHNPRATEPLSTPVETVHCRAGTDLEVVFARYASRQDARAVFDAYRASGTDVAASGADLPGGAAPTGEAFQLSRWTSTTHALVWTRPDAAAVGYLSTGGNADLAWNWRKFAG
ncbi:Hsp70 family protein [Actinocatenispora rupis]|uniref:Hsp70 protein n=1 Tax=Actinocatenispora rupis TaxID=519421 RepID=A0A8J3J0R3_9ACTN|nr:Hsp70 family protein [Actinocatenispora rupis]GID09812.1 hypothetical protein Aru02nite_07010 [Actinocatenispora rupis]